MLLSPFPHILLIDDHAMFRAGLRMVLSSGIQNAEIFEVGSVCDAINHAPQNVNVVLLDIVMKSQSGLEGIALLKAKWPLAYILVLSSQDDAETKQVVLKRGANDFMSKAETADKMVETINFILCDHFANQPSDTQKTIQRLLTPRQREVLDLLYQGMSNKRIARQLTLSDNTVRRHVQDILEYFQVSTRAEAVFVARQQRLVG